MGAIRQLLLSQVIEIENQAAELAELEAKKDETSTAALKFYRWALKSILRQIEEIEDETRETPQQERSIASSVAAMLPTDYFKDKRQKLEKEKARLQDQRTACQKIVSALEEKIECEESRVAFVKEVVENTSKLRELEEEVKANEKDLLVQVEKFGAIADEIDWEAGWKTRKSGLENKVRELRDHLEEE